MPRLEDPYEHPHSHRTATVPKTTPSYTSITPSEQAPDEAIQPPLRWFRRDDLVRKCTVTNTAFACLTGFDTELEPIDESLNDTQKETLLKQFSYVKAYVDQINRQVNLDAVLFITQIKRSIYGKAGFEIVTDKKGNPTRLISLQSSRLKPEIDKTWKLTGFNYEGKPNRYTPEELLYFVNLQLENDYIGISDIEPIMSQCESRHQLIKSDFPKITKRLWAPYGVHQIDGAGLTDQEETEIMNNIAQKTEAGEILVVNTGITSTVVDLHINIDGLINLKTNLEQDIISNYGTPRFLLNRPTENRATAYTEYEAYISGHINMIQRSLKRDLEAQWYPILVKQALKQNGYSGPVPVKISHSWRTIRVSDVYQMAGAVAALYNNGLGILADHPEVGWELMGFDPKILVQDNTPQQPQNQQQAPRTEQQEQEETVMQNE